METPIPRSNILLVEDDPELRKTLTLLFEDLDYTVAAAANGQEAFCYLQGAPAPRLILLDTAGRGLEREETSREERRQSRRGTHDAASTRALALLAPAAVRLRRVLARLQRYPRDARLHRLRRIAQFRLTELSSFVAALDSETLRWETGKTSLLVQGRRIAKGGQPLETV